MFQSLRHLNITFFLDNEKDKKEFVVLYHLNASCDVPNLLTANLVLGSKCTQMLGKRIHFTNIQFLYFLYNMTNLSTEGLLQLIILKPIENK